MVTPGGEVGPRDVPVKGGVQERPGEGVKGGGALVGHIAAPWGRVWAEGRLTGAGRAWAGRASSLR